MKKIIAFAVLFCVLQARAQVKFQNISLGDAIAKASNEGKIVFAQFVHDSCDRCNEIADKSFSVRELGNVVNKKCIAVKIEMNNTDRQKFIEKYNPLKLTGTYFIGGDGELIHRYSAATTRFAEYITQVDKAYEKLTEGKATLRELDAEWNNDPLNITAMELNLQKRSTLGLPTDSLLDVYVSRLLIDSISSVRTLRFIAMLAPILYSNANKTLHQNQYIFSQAWNSLPLNVRVSINNRRAYKSMQKAINEKNYNMAIGVANFLAGTHSNRSSLPALQAYDKQMLDYFIGIKDTINYLEKASAFYDKYYMTVSAEDIKRKDSAIQKQMLSVAGSDTIRDPNIAGKYTVRRKMTYAPSSQFFTNELNRGAWLIYTSTQDKSLLTKASGWSKHSIDIFSSPEAMDTYARLQYKLGNKDEAIVWEDKAAQLIKSRKLSSKAFEDVLVKMKTGDAKIDNY